MLQHSPSPGRLCVALLALSALAACASTPERTGQQLHHALAAGTRAADPHALAAAGLIQVFEGPPGEPDLAGRLRLLQQAVAVAPDRPELLWLEIRACTAVRDCDPAPAEERLQSLDPGNGIGWYGALHRAVIARDDAAIDAAVEAISRRERVDIYWTTLTSKLATALSASHELPLSEGLVQAIGLVAGIDIPPYQSASIACRGERLLRPGVIDACRAMAAALGRGDSYLTEMIGTAMARRLWPADSSEWAAANAARRVAHYRMSLQAKDTAVLWNASAARRFERLLAGNRREQDFIAAALTARGLAPNPPPGWLDHAPD